jgi:hypothetical protein
LYVETIARPLKVAETKLTNIPKQISVQINHPEVYRQSSESILLLAASIVFYNAMPIATAVWASELSDRMTVNSELFLLGPVTCSLHLTLGMSRGTTII